MFELILLGFKADLRGTHHHRRGASVLVAGEVPHAAFAIFIHVRAGTETQDIGRIVRRDTKGVFLEQAGHPSFPLVNLVARRSQKGGVILGLRSSPASPRLVSPLDEVWI